MKTEDIIIFKRKNGKDYSIRKSRARIFSPDEWNIFLSALKHKNTPLFKCLINTGGRINEVLNLKKFDIDLSNKTLHFRITKKRSPYSLGSARIIKISSQYADELKDLLKDKLNEDWLFPSPVRSNHITKAAVGQVMKRALKKSGIPDPYNFSLHNIRKTIESWLCYLGVNPLLICKHFGHNTTTALKHYVQPDLYNSSYKYKARQILGDLYM